MQYFLIFVILVACGGAYYEHTLAQAQNDTDQAQIRQAVTAIRAARQTVMLGMPAIRPAAGNG